MPSLIDDRHDWPLDGAPISNDFRAQAYTADPGRSRYHRSAKSSGCKACAYMETNQQNRYYHKSRFVSIQDSITEGKALAGTTLSEQYNGSGPDEVEIPDEIEQPQHEDAGVKELWRLGLLYNNKQERGPGVSLDVITHDEQEFSISYKPLKRSRRGRKHSHGMKRTPLSPALSFVIISSDEELAASLSVYDFIDVGPGSYGDEHYVLV